MKKSTLKFLAVALFTFMGTFAMAQTQYEITFTVDMAGVEGFTVGTDDVWMSGDFAGWTEPGTDETYKMTFVEGTLFSLTATIDSGLVQYKYFKSMDGAISWASGEWDGDPNRTYYTREVKTLEDMWGTKPQEVTFNVDMSLADPFDPATDAVYIAGDFASSWAQPGTLSPFMLTTVDDVNYILTLNVTKGEHMYKYFLVSNGEPSWDGGEWAGDPNRALIVDTIAVTLADIWAEQPAGIFNEPNEFTYSMYPNPVISVLNIDNTADASQVDVFDATGRMVRSIEISAEKVVIDVADLETGVYIVNVHNEKGTQSSKFVKN